MLMAPFPDLTVEENRIVHDAREKGFAVFFPAYPDRRTQAMNTLRAAVAYLDGLRASGPLERYDVGGEG